MSDEDRIEDLMNEDQINGKIEELITELRLLREEDFQNPKIGHSLKQSTAKLHQAKKLFNQPAKPDTCIGFIGDCDRKPSKYYSLRDAWYCIGCWNEMYEHYAR